MELAELDLLAQLVIAAAVAAALERTRKAAIRLIGHHGLASRVLGLVMMVVWGRSAAA